MAYLILFLMLITGSSFARELYTMADLEALAQEENYSEFFEHALDIRPSERQESWKTMVSKLGDIYSRNTLQKAIIEKKDFDKIEDLFGWPILKSDDVFRLRRQQVGIRYLKACLKKNPPCLDELKSFWEKDKSDADTAYKLAELTLELENSPISTWSFLETALNSPLSEFYCKKDFVMDALWGKIEIDYVKLGKDGDLMKKIDQTIHPDCVPYLVKEARKRIHQPPKLFDRELSFQILKSQMKADQEITDFFYTVYLLDNPSKGELFNYSWNRMRELGKNINRREKVLKKLKNLDPLPDGILSTLDNKKKEVILKHFKAYFPEYFDHYAGQCLKFYGGTEVFPKGNPTIGCQDFMTSDLAPVILDEFKIQQYQKVREI